VVAYCAYYDLADDHARSILELAFRENVFVKRYFRS
jgi:hypothetical protein